MAIDHIKEKLFNLDKVLDSVNNSNNDNNEDNNSNFNYNVVTTSWTAVARVNDPFFMAIPNEQYGRCILLLQKASP